MSSQYSELYNNLMGTSTAKFPKERKVNIDQLRNKKTRGRYQRYSYRGPDSDDLQYFCDEEEECVIPGEKLREKSDREKSSFRKVKKLWKERRDLMGETKPRLLYKNEKPYRGPLVIRTKKESFFEKRFEKYKSEYYIAHDGHYNNYKEDMKKRKGDDNTIRASFLIEKNKQALKKLVKKMRTNVLIQELKLYEDVQDHSKRDVIKDELKSRGKEE